MAETLGSLIDKLTIKSIREYYIRKMLQSKRAKFSKKHLKDKLNILQRQKRLLMKEIEEFVVLASKGAISLKEEKIKLYNKPEMMGRVRGTDTLSKAIDNLSKKNLELWRLEDEARREDVPLAHIGTVKRKIDVANQNRNDLIDRIDELIERKIKAARKK